MGIQQEISQTSSVSTSNENNFSQNFYYPRSNNKSYTQNLSTSPKIEAKTNSPLIIEINARKQRELEAQQLWRKANAVCFDVDSTVCKV